MPPLLWPVLSLLSLLCVLTASAPATPQSAHADDRSAAQLPVRDLRGIVAPAYPLIAHNPFVSWWSPTVDPTASAVRHVRNDKEAGMTAMVRVNGVAYRLLGPECTPNVKALPLRGHPEIWPTRTIYRFEDDETTLSLNLTFATPKLMEDLTLLSLPITFVYVDVAATARRMPAVEVFFETSSQMVVEQDSQPVVWRRDDWADVAIGVQSMAIGTAEQEILRMHDLYINPGQPANHLEWGYLHLTVPSTATQHASTWMGASNFARGVFVRNGSLPTVDNQRFPEPVCGASGQFTYGPAVCACNDGSSDPTATAWSTLAATFKLGLVSNAAVRSTMVISVDDLGSSARFFGKVLPEYWRRDGTSFDSMLQNATAHHKEIIAQCERYDEQTVEEFRTAGGEDYAVVASASFRQTLADQSLLWFDGTMQGRSTRTPPGAMMFVKGLGTSGDTATLDDNLDAIPMFLWRQPELISALLRPIQMYNSRDIIVAPDAKYPLTVRWPDMQPVSGTSNNYSIHYLGQYPIAEMQCWDHHPDRPWHKQTSAQRASRFFCEPMPLEATADVIIYTALAVQATNDTSMASLYLTTLRTFANYVEQNGRDPVLQLYTDDYLGPSALNANLAAKSIIALGAFAQLCDKLGLSSEHMQYREISEQWARYWMNRTAGGLSGATRRTYSIAGSFSAKTNLLFDRLLQTDLFPHSLMTAECGVMRETAGPFGWLLDERGMQTNKTNIETELVVALCPKTDQADYFQRIVRFLGTTGGGWAFPDTYDSQSAERLGGEGRSQVGGVFAQLALQRLKTD